MHSSSLIQALLLWHCLQWRNAGLYSVLFDVVPCYWKSLCKIPRAQNSWRYESIVLTNRIAGKPINIKKIKLLHDTKDSIILLPGSGTFKTFTASMPSCIFLATKIYNNWFIFFKAFLFLESQYIRPKKINTGMCVPTNSTDPTFWGLPWIYWPLLCKNIVDKI